MDKIVDLPNGLKVDLSKEYSQLYGLDAIKWDNGPIIIKGLSKEMFERLKSEYFIAEQDKNNAQY